MVLNCRRHQMGSLEHHLWHLTLWGQSLWKSLDKSNNLRVSSFARRMVGSTETSEVLLKSQKLKGFYVQNQIYTCGNSRCGKCHVLCIFFNPCCFVYTVYIIYSPVVKTPPTCLKIYLNDNASLKQHDIVCTEYMLYVLYYSNAVPAWFS